MSREEWRSRTPNDARAKRLRAAAWVVTVVVLALVGAMQRIRLPLPDGWDLSFLPPFHAAVNALAAVVLVAALVFVRRGEIERHRAAMMTAMVLSLLFLLSYVAYHITHDPTTYGGVGPARLIYYVLLISHIVLAAVSFPFILFTFVEALADRFERHRRLARWVFPLWLYVAVTGPVCYLMLRPYY